MSLDLRCSLDGIDTTLSLGPKVIFSKLTEMDLSGKRKGGEADILSKRSQRLYSLLR